MTAETVAPTLSFSPIASCYDERYQAPTQLLMNCYDRLVTYGALPAQGVILDAGCGTGQMSLPLAERGYEIRGYDVSEEMVAAAQKKVAPNQHAKYMVGDVRKLPEQDGAVDAVIACKLLVHVSDWRNAVTELLRTLKSGASFIQLNDAVALENTVRDYFGKLANEAGFENRFLGLHPAKEYELVELLDKQGCSEVRVDVSDLSWSREISYGVILDQFKKRFFAEFWPIPVVEYERILEETARWVDRLPMGRNTVETIVPRLYVRAFRKS
ncbi:class I SAM-dependent methyltransferase [Agrobacterium leguminum]|uniref:Type 11 methyltransferase n=1 Tax=Agrobacterium deltaense NCPPB 1641 TaxID=1183425 RepID=A0A1S7TRX7_9HYPH|nr:MULTISPECIES: class I SAM-dependent methyltransferase [Agrobacterium]WFS69312.1 class I SAM-dependent methyltransferase [Agrobacterium leguminum]CVI57338.1 Type 11 methyltransferase [Agrobacterium deltaense NCPPB 1641]